MDTILLWVGRVPLIAALTFPVWGCVILAWLKKEQLSKRLHLTIQGTITFWIFNMLILDLGAGLMLFLTQNNAQAFTDHWRWFWNWGTWLVLALVMGNAIMIWYKLDIKSEEPELDGFIGYSYIASIAGGVFSLIIWLALNIVSMVTSTPIPPAQ